MGAQVQRFNKIQKMLVSNLNAECFDAFSQSTAFGIDNGDFKRDASKSSAI
jgi:hypothetical protein